MDTPNTMLDESLLTEKLILICGEDKNECINALNTAELGSCLKELEFRFYVTKKYADVTVILSAMGTGPLEPLLFELLQFKIVKSVVLIGTAGKTTQSKTILGEVYVIDRAYVSGTALDGEIGVASLTYNFPCLTSYKTASIVSTDFYYGFSMATPENRYPERLKGLSPKIGDLMAKVDLIDMEVGQFYALCRLVTDSESQLRYVAIKGPSNVAGRGAEQNLNTPSVLSNALSMAIRFLGVKTFPVSRTYRQNSSGKPVESSSTKMMEEIKLYWTIQTAIVSVLGFLATQIDFAKPGRSFIVILSALMVITIGSIYNIVGNYYVRDEAVRIDRASSQENVITPHICVLYWVLGAILGVTLGLCFKEVIKDYVPLAAHPIIVFTSFTLVTGTLIYLPRKVFKSLYTSPCAESYREYAEPLRSLFEVEYPPGRKHGVGWKLIIVIIFGVAAILYYFRSYLWVIWNR